MKFKFFLIIVLRAFLVTFFNKKEKKKTFLSYLLQENLIKVNIKKKFFYLIKCKVKKESSIFLIRFICTLNEVILHHFQFKTFFFFLCILYFILYF